MQPEVVSVSEALKLTGLGMTKTYELINSGELASVKIGRRRMIRLSSIRQLIGGDQVAA